MAQSMVKIASCDQQDCAYNKHNSCHTLGITIGGPSEQCPQCDTYIQSSQRGGLLDLQGGVGACKVESCSFNDSLECNANSIKVSRHSGHPDCATFKQR